jgi:hypothetical protein
LVGTLFAMYCLHGRETIHRSIIKVIRLRLGIGTWLHTATSFYFD